LLAGKLSVAVRFKRTRTERGSRVTQPALFYDSYLEALRDDVNAIGGPKEVGHTFWGEKEIVAARNAVNDRLNAEKRDRFTDEQERYIIRAAKRKRGFSAALYFICDDTEFERPAAKSPDDERAAALRTIADASRELKRALDTIERLQPAGPVVRAA
jgi:hypothetical protein